MREFINSSDEGPMIVRIREKMNRAEYEEIEQWFGIILRQAKRRITPDAIPENARAMQVAFARN